MSRFSANLEGETIAVLHRAGGSWRVLIVQATGRLPVILDASEFPDEHRNDQPNDQPDHDPARKPAAPAALRAHLQARKVTRVVGVVPAAGVVCRTCSLPQADRDQLQAVLELQAEGQFLGHTPDHRIAMSVLPTAPGETSRSGIVLSWPEAATGVAPSLDGVLGPSAEDAARRFCPDVAGLAALLNGVRPPEPLVWLDRADGSVALAITHANGAVFRCTREALDSDPSAGSPGWHERTGRAIAETAISVGHTGAFVESLVEDFQRAAAGVGRGAATLFAPDEILASARSRFEGAPDDPAWWSTYGIAAGVVLAATGELAPLAAMKDAPVVRRPSRWRSLTEAMSRPRVAIVTTIACLAVLGLAPPAMSGLRLSVLKLRHPDIGEQAAAVERAREQIAMFRALDGEAWSMTKILADVASNTPEGIDLDSIRVQHSDSTFAVSGLARPHEGESAPDVVARMQENLRDSRLFREVRLNWGKPNRFKHYEFELSAKVAAPHRAADYPIELDFARYPLAARERGEPPPEDGAAPADRLSDATDDRDPRGDDVRRVADTGDDDALPADALAGGADDSDDRPARPSRRFRMGGVGDGPAGAAANPANVDERPGGMGPGLDAAPEPMSPEQIAAMTKSEVLNRLTVISAARERAKRAQDEELEERLQTEFDALFARLRELK